ncbi:hypothetical protein MFRU_011g00010 [Monilinia fructicola]|uniref:Dethiobiotin synthase n=1 Tax=Monilinia fructicola TaxID=38448 RepID=A0A5M9JRD2_MONFR|nr:hypothetical protein EYC84_000348 [Monilinia fructicola]KAG4030541.1 hypothetical protein MFRU_011g00010 [Monilinia fructicola]
MYKPPPSLLSRSLPVYHLTASNTSLGKTIFSTLLCRQLLSRKQTPYYLKPVSTGPLNEADDGHIGKFAKGTKIECLFRYGEAVSPHIAARGVKPPNDHEIVTAISEQVQKWTKSKEKGREGLIIVEGAGGVHSPTPSGTSQVDALRPLRMPVFLVGDPKLGGISATISAWESLHLRGYDIESVLIFQEERYGNYAYLSKYFQERGITTTVIPPPPKQLPDIKDDEESMASYYSSVTQSGEIEALLQASHRRNISRIEDLEQMATRAHKTIWYPFTQMKHLSPETILPIDSAYGDYFQTLASPNSSESTLQQQTQDNLLTPTLDGSGSWWTQGLGHGNPQLALAAAYASGRYGHCIFASTIHSPALKLANHLLTNLKNPRLSRVFYSDNGSTGMEVAVKMALTAAGKYYQWGNDRAERQEVGIIGLKGSYHGDTIGAMDLSEGSVYNEKVHWYKGRGLWFDVPKVWMKNGKWVVHDITGENIEESFDKLEDVFGSQRDTSKLREKYEKHIEEELKRAHEKGMKFGALVIEPIILGAGGMLFCDPLFQRTLTNFIRNAPDNFFGKKNPTPPETPLSSSTNWTGLPIIHDEVLTGLYRLGHFSPSTLLHTHPDISVHAKLLTGGLLPLCTTLASENIYEAFLGDEKSEALLHGHSYTGHAVGCEVARVGLETMQSLDTDKDGHWEAFRRDWAFDTTSQSKTITGTATETEVKKNIEKDDKTQVWSVWSKNFVTSLSHLESVDGVIALGSVLAITFKDEQGGGYTSKVTEVVRDRLLGGQVEGESNEWNIHARILGNVIYIMGSQVMTTEQVKSIEQRLGGILGV